MASSAEFLSRYFSGPLKAPQASTADIAKFIVLNAQVPSLVKGKPEVKDPSVMSRIFDILSRPNYAVANFTKGLISGDRRNPVELAEDFISGLAGTQKTTFSDVLEEAGMPDSPQRAMLGLGLDIFADPTTYIPGAVIAKGLSKIKPAVPKSESVLNKGEPVNPELFGLPAKSTGEVPLAFTKPEKSILPISSLEPTARFTTSQPTLPGFESRLRLPEITHAVGKQSSENLKGQLSFKLTDDAGNIIKKVEEGDVSSSVRVTPIPKPKIEYRHETTARRILSAGLPRTRAKINKKRSETVNPSQQASLYRKSLTLAKGNHVEAYKIYLGVEKALEAQGRVLRLHTGEDVKLSDVIQHLGGPQRAEEVLKEFSKSKIKSSTPTWQAVQSLRASKAIEEAPIVKKIADSISSVGKEDLSNAQLRDFDSFLRKFSAATAKTQGLSESAQEATEKLVDFTLRSNKTAAEIAIEQKAKMLDDIVTRGVANIEVNRSLTKALESDLGKLPPWAVDDNKAMEFMMARVATWWGQKDLRPLSLNAIGSSAATATARGKALDRLFSGFDVPQQHEAFKLAQGFGTPSSPEVADLAVRIKKTLDNLVGRASGTSVVLRSGINRDLVNAWMRRYKVGFEFSNSKVKNLLGEELDFSEGTSWLDSWKVAKIKEDPKIFLFKFQQALEQATREKALFDEIGERFGSPASVKQYRTKITGYPYIEGYYFPEEIAKQIPRVIRDWSAGSWHPQNSLLKHYDRVLSMWKAGVTIYRPAHHIRNMIGDIYLGWMDGVNSVRPYMLAAKVQRVMRSYTDINDIEKLIEIGAVSRNFSTPQPNQVIFTNKSGVGFSAEQIAAAAQEKGLLEHARILEDIIDLGEQGRFKPFGGKVQAVARGASELQNHNARLAHFIDKIAKSRGNDIAKIFEEAARRSRKWHPSGLDLTEFEKKYLRRLIPFYSWVRKSTPLLIEGLVMNPGKSVIPAKIYDSIQEAQGIDTTGRSDPFPVDQMFPHWIRAQGIGPIALPDGFLGSLSNQHPPGYVMGGMGLNPLTQMVAEFETPGKTIATSLTPAFQIPTELMTGRKIFTQEPITGLEARPDALEQYVGEQIPIYSALQGITGITPFGTETKKGADLESLVNWLTAAGIKGTGPYVSQARFEKLAPLKMKRKIGKEEFLEGLRDQIGNS